MPFLSWSWAGWETPVELQNIFVGFVRREIDWFIINQTGIAIQLNTPGSFNSSLHPQMTSSNKSVRPPGMPPKEFLEKVQSRIGLSALERDWEIPRFLACWTTIASFKLTGERFDLDGYGGTSWELLENLVISDNTGNSAGSIVMKQRWKTETLISRHMFEFMLLSRSNTMGNLIF
jgi:hypothetical protein